MKLLLKKKSTASSSAAETVPAKSKRKLSKKQMRVISIILVIAILTCGFFAYKTIFKEQGTERTALTASAQIGSVSSVIEGSGTLAALQQYEITSLIKGEVVEDFFEEGDTVKKDDILYRMDNESGMEAIDNAKSSLKKAERNYNNATESINDLVVKSKGKGVVTQMYIEVGDNVNANTKVADVIDNTNMVLEIQFLSDYASSMTAGQSAAEVILSKNGTLLQGTVTKVSTGHIISSVGAKVTNVEITVPNPGAIMAGDYATASVNGLACSSEGSFKNAGKSTIYTEVSGKVENLYIMSGDNVSYGQRVAVLSNDNLTDIQETADNYQESVDRYNDAVEALEDYVVKAPIDGKIIQKNIKAGEKMDNNSSSVMAIIADLSALVFEMSVDELDISKLKVGMDVEIEADAIENVTFSGTVTNISIVGSSNNGVTTYPVKITLNPKDKQAGMAYASYDKLIPGLNVSASVVIEKAENVIVVPVSAVRRGNIVIIKKDSTSEGISMEEAMRPAVSRTSFGSDGAMKPPAGFGSDGAMKAPSGFGTDKKMPSDGYKMPHMSGETKMSSDKANSKSKNKTPTDDTKQNKSASPAPASSADRLKNMLNSLDIPDGYKAVFVETGLSDESFIEIKRGLAEGDVVLLPDTTAAQNGGAMKGQMPGGMGGMPGGMGGISSGMPGSMGGMRTGNSQNRSSMGQNRSMGGMR